MKLRRWLVGLALLLAVGAGVLYAGLRGRGPSTAFVTASVDRGDILSVVGATGALEAVTTVQVGSQVSGNIQSLHADFNSHVARGEVIARLDPSLFQARLEQARANRASARANVDRARAQLVDAELQLRRARELADQALLAPSELDTAVANQRAAEAQLKAAEAAVEQAAASVNQAEVDLRHTVIQAPIDGVVVARNVDVGQTVAASLQAPTLFVIAEDLRRMQVKASIDEADVGRVRAGQEVEFRVDAYPEEVFKGRVEQVRLQPQVVQNVVTYDTIIAVDNADERLMPGMTATVSVVVERREGVLRVPAAALRFRPAGFDLEAFRRQMQAQRGGPPGAEGAAGAGGTPDGGTHAESAAVDRSAAGPDSAGGGRPGQRSPAGDEAAVSGSAAGSGQGREATGPGGAGPRRFQPGLVFVLEGREPQPVRVALGLSDGAFTEVRRGLEEGALVVVSGPGGASAGTGGRPSASPGAANPFQPRPPERRQR